MDTQRLTKLEKDYGNLSSWAVWDVDSPKDTTIISKHINKLHSRFVIVGLNMSIHKQFTQPWANFHGGKHDGKLLKAFNNQPKVRGAYMTDLIKRDVTDSAKIEEYIANQDKFNDIRKQIKTFQDELVAVGVTTESKFILLGHQVKRYFNFFVNQRFYKNERIYLRHYSDYRLTETAWVDRAKQAIIQRISNTEN